jgi:SAM-dependent methyltransferase
MFESETLQPSDGASSQAGAEQTGSEAAPKESWDSGAKYDAYVGRWSALVAGQFVDWLAPQPAQRWLDVGCGTGVLCRAILARAHPRRVTGLDASPNYVAYARRTVVGGRATFQVGDAQALPFSDGAFDVAVSGLVLNFVPEPQRMVGEILRVVGRNGTVALYVWDYREGMQFMRAFWDTAVELDPAAAELDEGLRFPIAHPDTLRELFEAAGARDIEVRAIDVPTVFRNFLDFWDPFLAGQGPAPGYVRSLADEGRDQLRARLHDRLPIAADGSIALTARAWAVRAAPGVD